jgi:hypothetical protein
MMSRESCTSGTCWWHFSCDIDSDWLGRFIYLSESAYTFRYLFPGLLGFGIFVIFPIAYMVFLSFTKYSSQNLLTFNRSLGFFAYHSLEPTK